MWNLKCTIIPVIIGATGIVMRSLRKNLEAVPGKHSTDSLQTTAMLGTTHIIRKVLQCEAWSLSGGDHCWFKRITGKNRPVTRDIHNTSSSSTSNSNNNNNNNNEERITVYHKSSSPSTLQPWEGPGLLKQMSPASPVMGIRPPISTAVYCVFLYPVNPSWLRSATFSVTSRVCPH